ncbi:MAG: malto-oligosyltrehalose trehalohydrolase [Anaerolineales bacterium]
MTHQPLPELGARPREGGGTDFRVWAPQCEAVALFLPDHDLTLTMQTEADGYFAVYAPDANPGTRYVFRLDGEKDRPDPASRSQPDGVHAASEVLALDYDWQHATFTPPSLRNSVFYELHVGTFTPEGTFEAIIPHLARLRDLGITSLQLMPVVGFPGARNWGYDGVNLYAPHPAYGGARGLQRLIDAAHGAGLAVYLDAVYNHLGPEGNYLWDYGPYFTHRYASPWGESVNLDGPHSDHVRHFFIQNALYWLEHFRVDGFRFDATHALLDFSAYPFMEALTEAINEWAAAHNRHVHCIAENDRSDPALTRPRDAGGSGMQAQWLDDMHHILHVALTGENDGYYADYADMGLMAKIMRDRFAYTGEYSPARRRRHGRSAEALPADRFIANVQTHDQVGNRMLGERLNGLTDFDGLKLAAGLLCTAPFTPLLFMGQEYAEPAPFLYFVSHGDPGLVQAVQQGRAEEFADFEWRGEPPDPQSENTFARCKLDHPLRDTPPHSTIYALYQTLLALRHNHPALRNPAPADTVITAEGPMLALDRYAGAARARIVFNFATSEPGTLDLPDKEDWHLWLDSCGGRWRGEDTPQPTAPDTFAPGKSQAITLPPKSFVIYHFQEATP